jgi:VWFA-related protein
LLIWRIYKDMITPRWGRFCLLFVSLSCGFAQQNRSITLDVVVTDKSGKSAPGLEQQDFTLLDNKQPNKIVSFNAILGGTATADPPVEVILLVDEANTAFKNVAFARDQIEKFLQRNGAELEYPTSLVFLSDTGIASTSSTRDGNALIAELHQNKNGLRIIGRAQGVYGSGDRVELSLHALEQFADYESTKPGRKLVIWLSPGWPLLSGPRIQLSPKEEQSLFKLIVALSDALRVSRITLYSIDPLGMADSGGLRELRYESYEKGVKKANGVHIGNVALQVLAEQSGGRALQYNNDIAGEIATCIADTTAFYVLSFEALRGDGPNEYHALEIKIDKPGLKARTRAGYYAQP